MFSGQDKHHRSSPAAPWGASRCCRSRVFLSLPGQTPQALLPPETPLEGFSALEGWLRLSGVCRCQRLPRARTETNVLFALLPFCPQVSTAYYPAAGSLGHPAAIVTLPHLQHHIPAYMYVRELRYAGGGGGHVSFSVPSPEASQGAAAPVCLDPSAEPRSDVHGWSTQGPRRLGAPAQVSPRQQETCPAPSAFPPRTGSQFPLPGGSALQTLYS